MITRALAPYPFAVLLACLPMIFVLLPPRTSPLAYPPYNPPEIQQVASLIQEREWMMSDVPWAVAWYADRKSLWMPVTIKDFETLNDYNQLHGQLVGLYLTPITGNKSFIQEIVKGEYKDWEPFITRNVSRPALKDFPLRAVTALPNFDHRHRG